MASASAFFLKNTNTVTQPNIGSVLSITQVNVRCWLMKSEPGNYSVDDLKKHQKTHWDGVRNYQARNFMREDMRLGDEVLIYHSNAEPSGVAGLARVCRAGYPDFTAWDKSSEHFDAMSTPEKPRWFMVDIEFVEKFKHFISLKELKAQPELAEMMVVRPGARLSVQPVEKKHFEIVKKMGRSSIL